MSLLTRDINVYRCPACHVGVKGHAKYEFKDAPAVKSDDDPADEVIQGALHMVGIVVNEHNCVPKTQRGVDLSKPDQLR